MEPLVTEEVIARQPPEAQAIIRLLLARIAELEARLQELERQVKGKTPQNSSLPPSTQHPHAKPTRKRRRSKKRRGRQPGHPKHERPLIPSEDCDRVEPLKPVFYSSRSVLDVSRYLSERIGLPSEEHGATSMRYVA